MLRSAGTVRVPFVFIPDEEWGHAPFASLQEHVPGQ